MTSPRQTAEAQITRSPPKCCLERYASTQSSQRQTRQGDLQAASQMCGGVAVPSKTGITESRSAGGTEGVAAARDGIRGADEGGLSSMRGVTSSGVGVAAAREGSRREVTRGPSHIAGT